MNAAPLSPPAAVSPRDSVPAECRLPTRHGDFVLHGFRDPDDGKEHVALTLGTVSDGTPVLTRIHSECLTGDVFGSLRCDCGEQLDAALERIAAEGRGVLLYLRQEGRGIGLVNKIRAYRLQEEGADTVEANHMLGFAGDLRQYAIARRMLDALGVRHVRLMTNNPLKIEALDVLGVDVVQRVPLAVPANRHNERYLRTKSERMRHLLPRAARPAAHADDGGES